MCRVSDERGALDTRDITPAPGDRAMFVGQTGSGKTTLARVLLATRAHVVVLDAKGLLKWPDYKVYHDFDALTKAREPKLIYRPSWRELQDRELIDAFFAWVYLRRNCTVYVDELMSLDERGGDQYPPHFGACLTRGRELRIEVWNATQRPKKVPQVAISEAEHVYAFKLKLPQDRERVTELTGIESDALQALPKHDFLYARQDSETEGPLRLDL